MNDTFRCQLRKVLQIVDNCSAHNICYDDYENVENLYLPPNMAFSLQLVEAAIGRSFTAAFCRLLVTRVLRYVERIHSHEKSRFKLKNAVTIYDDVRLFSKHGNYFQRVLY